MGFAMPIDGQTFTWDEYLEPVSDSVPVVGDLVGLRMRIVRKLPG
jgi:hypothetical protein